MRHLGALRPANFQSCDSLSEKCPFQGWNRLKHQSYTAMLLSIPTPYFGFNRTKDTNLRFFTFPGFALGCFCCLAPALGNSERWCLDLLRFINGFELLHWSRIRLTCFPPQTLDKSVPDVFDWLHTNFTLAQKGEITRHWSYVESPCYTSCITNLTKLGLHSVWLS